jgi:ribosome biogenesis GTPase
MADSGIIIRALSGFYFVELWNGEIVQCRARGLFRKKEISPLVGDAVEIEREGETGTVSKIFPRKNELKRPPIANIDSLIIVSSVVEPNPNLLIIDKLTALCQRKNIEPVVIFSKSDLADASEYVSIYEKVGMQSFAFSSVTGENVDKFESLFANKICCLTGNSGVGKSSLINKLIPELELETNAISRTLGRGKHTTRVVSLYPYANGLIADTPGFSVVDFETGERIYKEDLPDCFIEFKQFANECKFSQNCSHRTDLDCAVRQAVEDKLIPESRYQSYLQIYDEVKDLRPYN